MASEFGKLQENLDRIGRFAHNNTHRGNRTIKAFLVLGQGWGQKENQIVFSNYCSISC